MWLRPTCLNPSPPEIDPPKIFGGSSKWTFVDLAKRAPPHLLDLQVAKVTHEPHDDYESFQDTVGMCRHSYLDKSK